MQRIKKIICAFILVSAFSPCAQAGVDRKTAAIVRSLKDPFISQLPKPKPEEPKAKPKTVPKPISLKVPEPVKPPRFTASGLIWDTDRPQAILNGQVVNIGDTIEKWTIITISQKGVEVTYRNKTFIIESCTNCQPTEITH